MGFIPTNLLNCKGSTKNATFAIPTKFLKINNTSPQNTTIQVSPQNTTIQVLPAKHRSYRINDIETIRFTKNGITIFTNDDKWFLLKCDILENIEHNNNN